MEGTGAWLYSYQEEAWWSVTQLAQQLMWVWVQKCNRDGTVWTHWVAVLSDANICLKHPGEHANEEKPHIGERTDRWWHVTTIALLLRKSNLWACVPIITTTVEGAPVEGWSNLATALDQNTKPNFQLITTHYRSQCVALQWGMNLCMEVKKCIWTAFTQERSRGGF